MFKVKRYRICLKGSQSVTSVWFISHHWRSSQNFHEQFVSVFQGKLNWSLLNQNLRKKRKTHLWFKEKLSEKITAAMAKLNENKHWAEAQKWLLSVIRELHAHKS